MRRRHNPGLGVREENRRAVGRQNAEQQVGTIGGHRVAVRALLMGPGPVDVEDIRRMDLVEGRQLGPRKHRRDGETPVLVDGGAIVIASVADVEAPQLPHRHAAAPAEESMRAVAERDRADDLDLAHSVFRMMMSSSAWLPTMKS